MESKAFKKNGKLKRSYRLFREVNTSLANLTEKLRYNKEMRLRIDEMREEWITGLSHDLKTPLASINGYAQLLVADEQYNWSKEETQKFARTILQKGAYMSELINDLNLTYRLQNDQISLDYEQVELNEFVRRCVISFINDPSHGQHLHFENYQESIYVSIDQALFQRVLENIIANAIKHNEKGTDVWVSILATKEDVFIRVKDNGSGMSEETKINLFQRYYRGTNTEERSCGTGLGMAISKQITQLHGAEINVESEVGKGTTITVSFTSVLHKAS
jgi:signal transduction histidine kinase